MQPGRLLKNLDFAPDKETMTRLEKIAKLVSELLEQNLEKQKIDAEVFVGGSFAKGTMTRSSNYDIDIFVRFDWKYESLSELLQEVVENVARELKFPMTIMHGSRDYFRMEMDADTVVEVIPVTKISDVKEARNVTDLSYFHVSYLKRRLTKDLRREARIAKQFCRAQKVYGAESYIQGFSGYALECLILHYGSFLEMMKKLSRVEEKIVIDPGKKFPRPATILLELNESKIQSPIVLVDPTWKERNVLAALSKETFETFKRSAKEFLKSPSEEFFVLKPVNEKELERLAKKKKAELVRIELVTDKQAGDIAGTKLKKGARFLISQISEIFEIIEKEFSYDGRHKAILYLVGLSRGEIERAGPPKGMKKFATEFKKMHPKSYLKEGKLYSKIKVKGDLRRNVEEVIRLREVQIKSMGIRSAKII